MEWPSNCSNMCSGLDEHTKCERGLWGRQMMLMSCQVPFIYAQTGLTKYME